MFTFLVTTWPSYGGDDYQTLCAMVSSKHDFMLVGSRRYGTYKTMSDWDFATLNTPEAIQFLDQNGFRRLPSYNNVELDCNTFAVYRKRKVDVKLVSDMKAESYVVDALSTRVKQEPKLPKYARFYQHNALINEYYASTTNKAESGLLQDELNRRGIVLQPEPAKETNPVKDDKKEDPNLDNSLAMELPDEIKDAAKKAGLGIEDLSELIISHSTHKFGQEMCNKEFEAKDFESRRAHLREMTSMKSEDEQAIKVHALNLAKVQAQVDIQNKYGIAASEFRCKAVLEVVRAVVAGASLSYIVYALARL